MRLVSANACEMEQETAPVMQRDSKKDDSAYLHRGEVYNWARLDTSLILVSVNVLCGVMNGPSDAA
jgi:hypothetical protein